MCPRILEQAEQYCTEHKYRLTEPRSKVLQIILESDKPLGAYEILERLGQSIKNPKPPTAYRAIDFWAEHSFIHKLESLNAYVACGAGHRHKGAQFMICDACGNVLEMHLCNLPQAFKTPMTQKNFIPSRWNLEIHGTCEKCV